MSESSTKLLGRWGEAKAADYLAGNGYKITGMGYCSRFGEIDVIAENRKFIVFVEVKTRKSDRFTAAREAVDRKKQERLISTAQLWMSENVTDKQPRFDVIEVYAPDGMKTEHPVINQIENAFEL